MIPRGTLVLVRVGKQEYFATAGVTVGDRVYVEWAEQPYPTIAKQDLSWHWPLVSECMPLYLGRRTA